MIYRKATVDDIGILAELRMEFLLEANGMRHVRAEELKNNIITYFATHLPEGRFAAWLCVGENSVIATSGISFYELPPTYTHFAGRIGYIMNMFTLRQFRRRGIATELFRKMLDEGTAMQVSKFILNATRDGKGLYEKFGFVSSGDEMYRVEGAVR